MKHIVLIHGRSTKPRQAEKNRLIMQSLLHGLNRVNGDAAQQIGNGEVAVTMVYYGDVNNALMWAAQQQPQPAISDDFLNWPYPFEEDGSYDDSLDRLFSIPTTHQDRHHYDELRGQVSDNSLVDELLDIISPIAGFFGISDDIINSCFPDLKAYFTHEGVGKLVRQRLLEKLLPVLEAGHEVCLVSHSMGTIVAYDVLWQLSRLKEYQTLHHRRIDLLVTLGSPLGDKSVSSQLLDADEPIQGCYPANIRQWHNFAAEDDFVSRDEKLRDNFASMLDGGLLQDLDDHGMYNQFVNWHNELNPHKLYGYLDNHKVARYLSGWIMS